MTIENIKILSGRSWNEYFPFQVVYEWEDVLASVLGIEIDVESTKKMDDLFIHPIGSYVQKCIRNTFLYTYIDSGFNYLKYGKRRENLYLCFVLYPSPVKNHFFYSSSVIPVILDCFSDVIDKIPFLFNRCPLVFVTSKEVYDHLSDSSLKGRLHYLPISISDKYVSETIPMKSIDVLQVGRKNNLLHEWMLKLTAIRKDINYVYQEFIDGSLVYFSSVSGVVGSITTRRDFMNFLGSAKISLLSSPGIDGGEKRTGGYNPVTPRFYESIVSYCYLVGRYPDSGDFLFNHINRVCSRPASYEEFEDIILDLLDTPFNRKEEYLNFIKSHLTSNLGSTILQEVEKL